MMIVSTIPMALSSVYKEIALGETQLDPIFLNGWICVFQFIFSIVLCVPAGKFEVQRSYRGIEVEGGGYCSVLVVS